MFNLFCEKEVNTFSANALVSAFCPTSSGTLTPAQPIHLASKAFTPFVKQETVSR